MSYFKAMFDDAFDEEQEFEDDFYSDIPEEAFYYEESAHKYGFRLGYKEASEGIDSESTVENFEYPDDADPEAVEIFKEAYFEGVEKFNNEFDDEDEEDEWD
ncbi:hypothetical protein H0R92_09380 [Treponema sp. OMZ 840]|uniref:hypothetical protein n=1 Tax=Treponema sp. OMZ 840 TaxID=244313 RepID=UPI003D8C56E2